MANEQNHDFLMERLLRQMNPDLHKRFTDAVFSLQHVLTNYKMIFPEYTDHTSLHTLTVIDFCNRLIGDQIGRLNADELYALLMGCYLHDTGMGITMKDYEAFSRRIDFGTYFDTHSRDDLPAIIRDFHHEYSGQFIRKYADVFEIPSREHEQAEMEEFATEHGIQYGTLREIMTEYVFSGNISDEAIRQHFRDYHFGLLKITKLTEETRTFAAETYKKYKAEGD